MTRAPHGAASVAAPAGGAAAGAAALSVLAVRALSAAVAQRRIYPPQHPIASRALSTLALYLERLLQPEEEWRVAVVGGTLLAGGAPLEERDEGLVAFAADMKGRGIETIVFRRGVGVDDLRRFVALMILDARAFAGTPLPERMQQEGIRTIEAGRLVLEDPVEQEREKAVREETSPDLSEAYDNALRFIEESILGHREGRKLSLEEAQAFVHTMLDQIQQDRSPALILTALKSHHAYTFTHIINVCILTLAQAEALGADARALREFGLASMMHDIGKTLLPREVLAKPGKLTPEEFHLIQRHPQDGVHILHETPGVPDLALIVAFEHHMRYNNAGYPKLRHPRALHPCSLMTNLADTYDAMRSRRAYQQEYPPEKVATLITERAGSDFHPELARAFIQVMGAYPPGTRVKIDTGEEGVVVRTNPAHPHRPMVRLLKDSSGGLVGRVEVVDLMQREQVGSRFARNILASIRPDRPVKPPAS
ncbi:MAG: HD domain-containing phosphohydrolase [Candidatus Polarisedimenticolia bacterium]